MTVVHFGASHSEAASVRLWPNPLRSPAGLRTQLRLPALSDDGRLLVAVSNDREIALLDLSEERLIGSIEVEGPGVLTLSSDGRLLEARAAGRVDRWWIAPAELARIARATEGRAQARASVRSASAPT